MFKVEAANDPVLITPLLVISMPFGLTRITVPGALMVPAIHDGVERGDAIAASTSTKNQAD